MVKCDSRNAYQKGMSLKDIELCAQNMIIIISSLVNIIDGTYMIIH